MRKISTLIKDIFKESKDDTSNRHSVDKDTKKGIKCLLIVGMVVILVFLIGKTVIEVLGSSFFQLKSPYSNSIYQYSLHKGYIVDYSKQGELVLLNSEGKPVLFAKRFFYKDNPTTEDSLFVYSKHGYRGFFNLNSGKDEISASDKRFLKAWFFDKKSGLAAVLDAKSQKIGFINPHGHYVIPPQYKYVEGADYTFDNDECVIHEDNGSCSLIDSKGRTILRGFYDISDMINEHRILTQNDKSGLWKDSLVLPIAFDDIHLSNSKIQLTQGNRCWSICYDYKTIIDPFIFDYINSITYEFQSKFTGADTSPQYCNSAKLKDLIICGLNNYEGIFNVKQQKMVVPIEWDRIQILKCADNEYALFGKKGDKYTLLKW
ncbi:hypothetical protein ACILE2_00045 [Capnocytophaga canimorsus]|uniref:hypothetical protein n=1 Tax=Capnocytophaga canimorsus TaxID=28188 RepID=UPI0037D5F457